MSVVVRMKNPDDCLKCGVRHICNPYVDYWQQDTRKKPKPGQKGCLILCPLPEGHGRLVDAEAAFAEIVKRSIKGYISNTGVYAALQEAPAIVPAEAERSE